MSETTFPEALAATSLMNHLVHDGRVKTCCEPSIFLSLFSFGSSFCFQALGTNKSSLIWEKRGGTDMYLIFR